MDPVAAKTVSKRDIFSLSSLVTSSVTTPARAPVRSCGSTRRGRQQAAGPACPRRPGTASSRLARLTPSRVAVSHGVDFGSALPRGLSAMPCTWRERRVLLHRVQSKHVGLLALIPRRRVLGAADRGLVHDRDVDDTWREGRELGAHLHVVEARGAIDGAPRGVVPPAAGAPAAPTICLTCVWPVVYSRRSSIEDLAAAGVEIDLPAKDLVKLMERDLAGAVAVDLRRAASARRGRGRSSTPRGARRSSSGVSVESKS